MGERLAEGNMAIALLANTIATGAALLFLIWGFIDVSGAHFNPVVTMTEIARGAINWREGSAYILVQIGGAFVGTGLANLMFELPVYTSSLKSRAGSAQFLGELIATFGLIGVIHMGAKYRREKIAVMVAAYITAAYWFTSSTSFANPAVTLARAASNTFAGIAPANVPLFILAQIIGAFLALFVFNWLLKDEAESDV